MSAGRISGKLSMDTKMMRPQNMLPHSLRWRLPLSYITIALLTVCALGAVLLATLRGYYAQQELDYLNLNARAISRGFEHLIANDVPLDVVYSQLENFSFLAQVKVRLLDADQQVLVETTAPRDYLVSLDAGAAGRSIFFSRAPAGENAPPDLIINGDQIEIPPDDKTTPAAPISADQVMIAVSGAQRASPDFQIYTGQMDESVREARPPEYPILSLMANRTPYGFALNDTPGFLSPVSDQQVTVPIMARGDELIGYLELSDGPAYGTEVVYGVAQALLGAGTAAALLAAGVGLYWSRRMSAPLLELTDSTTRMANGDLSVRTTVASADEFGLLAKSFNHMASQVETTVTALRRFVADAAHELHTPLTALSADLELAVTDTNTERQITFIERARVQLKRMETLTTDLLDLSRIETHLTPADHKPIDLVQLAQETSELYASRAEQAGIVFNLTVPECHVRVSGNETQLRRALGNLLDNALKFTPENGTITLGIQQQADEAELWVADTGIGIPPNDLPQLFSRFHRGRNAAAYPGSGLGLAITKAIAENHNGTVTVTSNGGGTRFALRLATAP